MRVELRALLRQFSELSRMLTAPETAAPREPSALGIDPVLPDGWTADAHRTGRSPWDGELERPRYVEAACSLLRDGFDSPTEKGRPEPKARIAPDRRTTEIDWRSLHSDEAS